MRALLMIVDRARSPWPRRPAAPQVTSQDLLDGLKDPTRWLTYSGDYSGTRHSPLTQITPENVNQLTAQWTFQTGTLGSFQTTPIVDRRRASTSPASTTTRGRSTRAPGGTIWRYRRNLPEDLRLCCGAVNRGFARARRSAVHDDARRAPARARHEDRRRRCSTSSSTDYKVGYSATVAPLVVKDKVIVGIAGAEYGIRGFIDAYDAQTGKRAWRFYTVAGPGRSRRQHLAAAAMRTSAAADRSG